MNLENPWVELVSQTWLLAFLLFTQIINLLATISLVAYMGRLTDKLAPEEKENGKVVDSL